MADAPVAVYLWDMESEPEHPVRGAAPLASMMSRVAELWRAQGDDFLEHMHADVVDDLTRLRDTSIVDAHAPAAARPELQRRVVATVEHTVHRLSEWDHAVMEGLRSWRDESEPNIRRRHKHDTADDDVVDLTAPDTTVDLTVEDPTSVEAVCAKHGVHHAVAPCRKCHDVFCDDFLLRPGGKVAPLCLDCALVLSGIRRH